MASRDIGGSIQAALQDLLKERAVVEDAIEKLQSLLANMKTGVIAKRRGRPPGSGKKVGKSGRRGRPAAVADDTAKLTKNGKRRGRPPGSGKKKKKKTKAGRKGWSEEARERARERMREYWAQRRGEG